MTEYIEREALLVEYDRVHIGEPGGARKLIENAPAADVVPVVRCKDCKLWLTMEWDGEKLHYCDVFNKGTHPDDFCSHGIRKDGVTDA